MKDKLALYIEEKIENEERSIRWMARQIGISNVHLGALLEGRQPWSSKTIKNVARALKIPLLQVYVMSGLITDADLEQYSVEQSLGDELMELLAVPGVREICHRLRRIIGKYPQYADRVVSSVLSYLEREMAICDMWSRSEKK